MGTYIYALGTAGTHQFYYLVGLPVVLLVLCKCDRDFLNELFDRFLHTYMFLTKRSKVLIFAHYIVQCYRRWKNPACVLLNQLIINRLVISTNNIEQIVKK
jgi:hypothetical protein